MGHSGVLVFMSRVGLVNEFAFWTDVEKIVRFPQPSRSIGQWYANCSLRRFFVRGGVWVTGFLGAPPPASAARYSGGCEALVLSLRMNGCLVGAA